MKKKKNHGMLPPMQQAFIDHIHQMNDEGPVPPPSPHKKRKRKEKTWAEQVKEYLQKVFSTEKFNK